MTKEILKTNVEYPLQGDKVRSFLTLVIRHSFVLGPFLNELGVTRHFNIPARADRSPPPASPGRWDSA